MGNQKIVKGPFIGLLILGILYLAYAIYSIILVFSFKSNVNYFLLFFFALIIPVVLFIEAFVYWRIRKRIRNKVIAWAHVSLLALGFLGISLFVFLFIYLDTSYFLGGNGNSGDRMRFISNIVIYSFLTTFILAHIFFVITIVKSFSKKQETIVDEQAPGLLDEFVE